MKIKRTALYQSIFVIWMMAVAAGVLFSLLHTNIPSQKVQPQHISSSVQKVLKQARIQIDILADMLPDDETSFTQMALGQYPGHAIYLYRNGNLQFWNNHQLEFDIQSLTFHYDYQLVQLNNAWVLYHVRPINDEILLLSAIPVKTQYPYENDYLSNEFNERFNISKNLEVVKNQEDAPYEISDSDGRFLFGLKQSNNNSNGLWSTAGFIAFSIAFLLLMWLYAFQGFALRPQWSPVSSYIISTIIISLLLVWGGITNQPHLLFRNSIFSPDQFAVNELISSLTHLSLFCFFLLTAIYTYFFKIRGNRVSLRVRQILLFIITLVYYEVLRSLIVHSSFSFNVFSLDDFHFLNFWAHLLIYLLGFGLIYLHHAVFRELYRTNKTIKHRESFFIAGIIIIGYGAVRQEWPVYLALLIGVILFYLYLRKSIFSTRTTFPALAVFILLLSITTFFISYQINQQKQDIRFRVLAENILVNGSSENDPIAELLLEELDKNLTSDERLPIFCHHPDSAVLLQQYVFQNHLRGFWNQYDVQVFHINMQSELKDYYQELVQFNGTRIKNTGFYSLPSSLYDMSFIGLFAYNGMGENKSSTPMLVLQFQPKRNFRSYSFPDLLVSQDAEISKQNTISVAKFEQRQLVYSDLRFPWSEHLDELEFNQQGFYKIQSDDHQFYVFSQNDQSIVITEPGTFSPTAFLFYFAFSFFIFLLVTRLIYWYYEIRSGHRWLAVGLTAKFQIVFILLLLISFLGILIFSVNYIRSNYQDDQVTQVERKKQYLQKSLQELYYWTEDIAAIDENVLNKDLEELAYRYQTDINIYDNQGRLMGSSQHLIFSKHLLSRYMSPHVFFGKPETENQYEQIGSLRYLAAYTDFINGDFLQIGYISIPQYFSQTEINAKIEEFLVAIIQIYLIIIVLSIIFVLIAGKQLSGPLHLLESKMKLMRLDGKNEKIEYRWRDEIGQLVEQYNQTVDELEKSTHLLLQSERESAWRTMAKQIAHEINNPLTPMKLILQQLQRTKKLDERRFEEYFDTASKTLIEQIDHLSRIAGTFSQFARMPETRFQRVDIAEKIQSVVLLFSHNHDNIDIQYNGPAKNVWVMGDPEQLIQVFTNILKNATQAIKSDSSGKINAQLTLQHDKILIVIEDNGLGIPKNIRNEIFRPNFTTKTTGMGLGLSISKNIIEHMGGEISFISEEGKGTRFEIILTPVTPENLQEELN